MGDTPSSGVIHRSSLATSPNTAAASSPVQDPVGKVHAVAGDLAVTPSAGGVPSLASLPDAGAAECETPRDVSVSAAPEPAAKAEWPGQDDEDGEEDGEEGDDAF